MSFSGTKGYQTKPQPGVMINPMHPLSRRLVGYWLFNEGSGSLANDISGNSNHGRLTNMSPNVQGSGWGGSELGGRLGFDGVNDYVDCGAPASLKITGDLTYSCWINFTSSQTARFLVAYFTEWNPWDGVALGLDDSNANKIKWCGDAACATGTTALNDGIWHHILGTYDGDKFRLYVDGVYDAISASETITYYADSKFSIGAWGHGGDPPVGDQFFNGSIDLVSVYNRKLSTTEIKKLYHNPFCNLSQVPIRRYSVVAPPVGAIMNQFQTVNLGADLYQGAIIA